VSSGHCAWRKPVTSVAGIAPKIERLEGRLRELGSVLVAYSGGIDSTFLVHVARGVLGDDALAVTAVSDSYSRHDREMAVRQAAEMKLGAGHLLIETRETEDPNYRANDGNRCFHCRNALMEALHRVAAERRIPHILLGAIVDDIGDHRPGETAARREGALFPLREAGLTKAEIRKLARERGLSAWDRPASACLSSRIAYGLEVTEERLSMVERAEEALRALGLRQFRVRHHGDVARIEVEPDEIARLASELREAVAAGVRGAGFKFVALDLQGYRQGSLNDALPGLQTDTDHAESQDQFEV
jgi:uncharacterized protein